MTPIEHRVRERAYFIWENEGRVAGRAVAHWIQAEIELAALAVENPVVESVTPTVVASAVEAAPVRKAATRAKAEAAPKASGKAKAPAKAASRTKKTARAAQADGIALH